MVASYINLFSNNLSCIHVFLNTITGSLHGELHMHPFGDHVTIYVTTTVLSYIHRQLVSYTIFYGSCRPLARIRTSYQRH